MLLLALAAACGLLGSWLAGDLKDSWWYLATLASTLTALGLARLSPRWLREALRSSLVLAALLLVGLVLLEGHAALAAFELRSRASLVFPDANLLAASLAVAGIASLVLTRSSLTLPLAWLFLAALLFAGSRTALLAYVLALVLWLLVAPVSWRVRALLFLSLGASFLGLQGWLNGQLEAPQRNLLRASDTLAHPAWRAHHAAEILLEEVDLSPPGAAGKVYRLRARSDPEGRYPTAVLIQSVGRSEAGAPYLGSVYLRAERPQTVRLGSNLTRSPCEVGLEWQRCVTPVGTGNGHKYVGLHLHTAEPGGAVDIYLWGAQLEMGTVATPPEPTSKNRYAEFVGMRLKTRLNPKTWQEDRSAGARLGLYETAWRMFLERPLVGAGLGRFRERASAMDREGGGVHAHNLPLQMLAETGVLGFLFWFSPFVGVLLLYGRRHWRRLLPLVAVVVVLNLTDYTYYSIGVYHLYWLAAGLILFSGPGLFVRSDDDASSPTSPRRLPEEGSTVARLGQARKGTHKGAPRTSLGESAG